MMKNLMQMAASARAAINPIVMMMMMIILMAASPLAAIHHLNHHAHGCQSASSHSSFLTIMINITVAIFKLAQAAQAVAVQGRVRKLRCRMPRNGGVVARI